MHIARVTPAEHSEFLELVNAEIRPDRAKTNAWDDFPLALGVENLDWTLAIRDPDGRIVAGLAALIRSFRTNWGNLQIAGLGSVVTHPDQRGRGHSSALQNEMLALLERQKVPLAVLWTDQPAVYAGRGFVAAGWEVHVDLTAADLSVPIRCRAREYRPEDAEAVEALYLAHPLGTLRRPGDSARLYGMPGTRGFVACDASDRPIAAVFCGKGADFHDYVTEWSGDSDSVLALLERIRAEDRATGLLAPAGTEAFVQRLVAREASAYAVSSGQWRIVDAEALNAAARAAGAPADWEPGQEARLLGSVDEQGEIHPGDLRVAVWGFDSV